MTDSTFYLNLRGALAAGIDKAEAEGTLPSDALSDVVRLCVATLLPTIGPEDTVIALRGLTRQLEKEFPEAKKKADEYFAIWERTRGSH